MFAVLALAAVLQSPQVTPAPVTPAPSPGVSPQVSPSASPPASPLPAVLSASPAGANLHPSSSLQIAVGGSTGTISAALDTPLVTFAVDQTARTISLTSGTQTGHAVLTVTDTSGASLQIPVRVALDAGVVPPALTLRVTGTAPDSAWLQTQIQRVVTQAVQLQPGTAVQIGAITPPALLGPGAQADVPVAVQIPGGDQFFDVSATTTVTLQNVSVAPFDPSLLFYDDDPEKVIAEGVLYQNTLTPQTPARLYYYHENTGTPRRVLVVLNAQQPGNPATVQVIDASAGPNIDVMSVGHAVSRDFLQHEPRNEGVLADVTGAPYVLDEFTTQPQDTVAGSIGMRVLSGGPVVITVLAVPLTVTDAQVAQYLTTPRLPGDGHHRTGTFSLNAYGDESLAFTVGGPDAFTQYGATTPPPQDNAGHDYGDYGVLRTLAFDVNNPGTSPATVYLYEEPMGGGVRSSFLVDGVLEQVGCARLSQKYQIGQPITVAPGASRLVVQTMTDGGSSYPLGVGVTTTPPIPQTPAITAPDGCFPKPVPTTVPATPQASPVPESSPAPTPQPSPEPTG